MGRCYTQTWLGSGSIMWTTVCCEGCQGSEGHEGHEGRSQFENSGISNSFHSPFNQAYKYENSPPVPMSELFPQIETFLCYH